MLTRDEHQDGYRLAESLGGASFAQHPYGVAVITYSGGLSGEVVPHLQRSLEAMLQTHSHVALFVDAEGLTTYTTDFRKLWAAWLKEHRARLLGCHILFKSALVRMGINLVNPFVGGFIVPYSDRTRYEAALDAAPKTPPPPPPPAEPHPPIP
ncbi:MAG: hypothetical protein AAGA54_20325, partial [Myxococcota bacterium]